MIAVYCFTEMTNTKKMGERQEDMTWLALNAVTAVQGGFLR
jgi:hypothetical protein